MKAAPAPSATSPARRARGAVARADRPADADRARVPEADGDA